MLSLCRPAGHCRPTVLALALVAAFAPAWSLADSVVESSVSAGVGVVDGNRADRAHAAGDVRRVALHAQHRRAGLEHRADGAAVRVVAGRAVLRGRLVRVHEGAALLGVAAVAGVVRAVALRESGAG